MKTLAIVSVVAISTAILSMLVLAQTRPSHKASPYEFTGGPWLNTKSGQAISLESRHGRPTLVAFWTFGCSNCQANIPVYARIMNTYRAKGVELIAIHTPEMTIEHELDQVRSHIRKFKIDYPVLIDNDSANWNRWKVEAWPTLFLLDGSGRIVNKWVGELNYGGANGEAEVTGDLDRLLSR